MAGEVRWAVKLAAQQASDSSGEVDVSIFFGVLFFLIGIGVVVFCRPLARAAAKKQREWYGDVGEVVAQWTKPLLFAIVGVLFIGFGVYSILIP